MNRHQFLLTKFSDVEKLDHKVQSLQNSLRKKVKDLNTTINDKTDELKQTDEDSK